MQKYLENLLDSARVAVPYDIRFIYPSSCDLYMCYILCYLHSRNHCVKNVSLVSVWCDSSCVLSNDCSVEMISHSHYNYDVFVWCESSCEFSNYRFAKMISHSHYNYKVFAWCDSLCVFSNDHTLKMFFSQSLKIKGLSLLCVFM